MTDLGGSSEQTASWWVRVHADGIAARSSAESLSAKTPAELWALVAEASAGSPVHLMADGMAPVASGVAVALRELREGAADAVVARIAYAENRLSPRWRQVEAMRFLDVPAGSFISTSEAL